LPLKMASLVMHLLLLSYYINCVNFSLCSPISSAEAPLQLPTSQLHSLVITHTYSVVIV